MSRRPPAFDRQGVSEDDLIDFTPALRAKAKKNLSHYRFSPIFTPPSLFKEGATLGAVTLPSSPLGTPITYAINGLQFVALTLLGGQMVALALP